MRTAHLIILAANITLLTSGLVAGEQATAEDELTGLKREYADVLALQGTAKNEILTIARILRANPKIAIDQTSASGEYLFQQRTWHDGSLRHPAGTHAGRRRVRIRRLRVDYGRLEPITLATLTRTRPNDARHVVFPSQRPARPASHPLVG